MNKTWTPEEQRILGGIEAKMIEDGVPEHRVRLKAEQELERRIGRSGSQKELHTPNPSPERPVPRIFRPVVDGERLSGHGNTTIGYPAIHVLDTSGPMDVRGALLFTIQDFHWA